MQAHSVLPETHVQPPRPPAIKMQPPGTNWLFPPASVSVRSRPHLAGIVAVYFKP